MSKPKVVNLNEYNDLQSAHSVLDDLLENMEKDVPASLICIMHQPGQKPVARYAGRELTVVELVGVLNRATYLIQKSVDD